MRRLLKIFLPYSLLAGIGVAVYVSNYHPLAETVVIGDDSAHDHASHRAEASAGQGGPWRDPVCRMDVNPAWGWGARYQGKTYYFCVQACRDKFAADPEKYTGDRCIVCQYDGAEDCGVDRATAKTETYLDGTYLLCCEDHRRRFQQDPGSFFMHTMWGTPPWMYFSSIAFVLVISFGLFEGLERRLGRRRSLQAAPAATGPLVGGGGDDNQDRIDLMRIAAIRWMLTSRPFRFVCQAVLVGIFLLVIAAGLFGDQNPGVNLAPILTWTVWWGGLVVLIMFAGKAWCYVCPWDAVAGWMEKMRLWKKTDEGLGLNLKWPAAIRNILLATLLFVGLTWIELGFGVTMKPRATAYLGIAMLLLAIVSAFLFARKSFCRYGCLVGRVSGLYALFSGIEFRSRDKDVCRRCRSKECVRGSDTAYGCPTFVYPGGLKTNTYCIQCGECLQACPHDNMAVNLRPWGSDLAASYRPRTDEAYLALLMLSITAFHGLTMTPVWGEMARWMHQTLSLNNLIAFSSGMAAIMFAPILVFGGLVYVSYLLGSGSAARPHGPSTYHDYFIRYAYAVLPIALFYHLAHNLEHLLMEGPKVIGLASDPFGWGWNLFGTLGWTPPPLVSLDVLWILQILLVLVGHVYSLWAAQRVSLSLFSDRKAALRSQLPMLVGMICFSVFSLWLLKQPMQMRTSAM